MINVKADEVKRKTDGRHHIRLSTNSNVRKGEQLFLSYGCLLLLSIHHFLIAGEGVAATL